MDLSYKNRRISDADAAPSRAEPSAGAAASSGKSWMMIAAIVAGAIVGVVVIAIVAVGLACPSSAFCFIPKSNDKVSTESTTTIAQVSTARPTTETKTTRTLLGPGNDYCFMRKSGVCVGSDIPCPFTPAKKEKSGCQKKSDCCVSTRGRSPDFTLLPARPNCGRIPSLRFRIISGFDTIQWPFMAAVMSKGALLCGATIISPTFVITAAKYVSDKNAKDLTVITGTDNIITPSSSAKTCKVKAIIKNPDYDDKTNTNNLALLEIEEISMNIWLQPACLPNVYDQFKTEQDIAFKPDICIMLGWGDIEAKGTPPNKLQAAPALFYNADRCKEVYDKSAPHKKKTISDKSMCIYLLPRGACKKDPGGPVLCQKKNRFVLAAVISDGGIGCITTDQPTVVTRVLPFMTWIKETVKDIPTNT